MKALVPDPECSRGQHWIIASGELAEYGLGSPGVVECLVHAWTSGPKSGSVEIDGSLLTPNQAEKLANKYSGSDNPGDQRIEAALFDVAKICRVAIGVIQEHKPG